MKNVPTCHPDKPYGGHGLCRTCYTRYYRNGKTLPTVSPKVYGTVPTCHPERKHRAHGLCHECYMKQYHAKRHPEPRRAYRQMATCHPDRPHEGHGLCRQCLRNTPERKASSKAYADKYSRRDRLKHHYGITPDEWDAMFKAQDGKCALCGEPPRGKTNLCVDHDHTTGQVRALLCVPCNRALGYFENPKWSETAASYLTKYKESHS